MEIEYFCPPEEADRYYEEWVQARFNWYLQHGMKKENLKLRNHACDELAHYAKGCQDIEYLFPFGWSELEGIANRGDYDLKQHSEFSGKDLSYFNEETKEKYFPYVIEPSAGADRGTLAFLIDAYDEETDEKGETRVVLRFHPALAPIKVAVLPLSKKPELKKPSQAIYEELRKNWMTDYDETGSIGKRYRRQDEIGTPFCVTIDFDSLDDKSVTLRERDSMKQVRLRIEDLIPTLREKMGVCQNPALNESLFDKE